MLYFQMDFCEITLDGLVDTLALSSAIREADLRKIRLLASQSIMNPSTQLPNNGRQWVAGKSEERC